MKTKKKIICTLLIFCMILCIFPVSIFVSASYLPADGISSGKVYFIMNVNSGKCFDVSAGNTANGSDVSQFTYTPSCEWQKWKITYCGNGDYKITDMHSGKLLSVEGSSSADNANAWIWQYDGTDGQFFRIRKNSDGTYTFLSKCSGYTKALGVYQEGTLNGDTVVQQSGDNGSLNQKYYIFVSNTATYNIQNVNSGKCMDVDRGFVSNGAQVLQYDYTPATQWQKWRILYVGNGNYIIMDSNSGKLLTVNYDSLIHDYWVYISSDGYPINQQYKLVKNSDGTYSFLTRYSDYNYALCILDGGTGNGEVIYQEPYNSNSNNQKFNIFLSQNVYHIKNFNSDKCLDVSAGNTSNGSDVSQYTYTSNSEWQRWQINYCGNGEYTITDMHSGKLLSIEASSSANNANAWIWEYDGTAGQYFRIRTNADGTVTFLTKASNYTKAIGIYEEGLLNGDTLVQQSNDDGSDNQRFVLIPNDIKITICASEASLWNTVVGSYFGHAWIEIHNLSLSTVTVGWWDIESGNNLCIGLWKNDLHNGVWYNKEVNATISEGKYPEHTFLSKFINSNQLSNLNSYIHNNNSEYHILFYNCVEFAVDVWNLVGCGMNIPLEDAIPTELMNYIRENYPNQYRIKSNIHFSHYYGYYDDSTNVFNIFPYHS